MQLPYQMFKEECSIGGREGGSRHEPVVNYSCVFLSSEFEMSTQV
jgi:hypothetical protein